MVLLGQVADLVVVQPAGLGVDLVGDRIEELAGQRDLPAVGEVPTVDEGHSHNGVVRLDESGVGGQVRHGARIRLDVGVVGLENLLGAVLGHFFDQVRDLLAFVVAFTGVALGIFVRQAARGGRHDGPRDVILGRNQADRAALAHFFLSDQFVYLRIVLFEGCPHTGFLQL